MGWNHEQLIKVAGIQFLFASVQSYWQADKQCSGKINIGMSPDRIGNSTHFFLLCTLAWGHESTYMYHASEPCCKQKVTDLNHHWFKSPTVILHSIVVSTLIEALKSGFSYSSHVLLAHDKFSSNHLSFFSSLLQMSPCTTEINKDSGSHAWTAPWRSPDLRWMTITVTAPILPMNQVCVQTEP